MEHFPDLNICIIGGTIYKNNGADKLTAEDINSYANNPSPTPTPVPTEGPTATPDPTPTPMVIEDFSTLVASTSTPVAKKVSTAIVADGIIDPTWDELPYYNIGDGTEAKAKVAWDDSNFYALVRVKDNDFDFSSDKSFERDGGELFFDESNSDETTYANNDFAFQYRLTGFSEEGIAAGAFTNEFASGSDLAKGFFAGIETGCSMVSDGYIMEFKVPWFFGPNTNETSKKIGFDIHVLSCSAGKVDNVLKFISQSDDKAFDPSTYGELELVE